MHGIGFLMRYAGLPLKIGLLGGSFNPPHAGHLAISHHAWTQLGLDCVWWLVSPQNPLKSTHDMASLAQRVSAACALTRHKPWVHVTDIELFLGTRFTVETLIALQKRLPRARFLWLMGADNLQNLPRWERWETLASLVPFAVFRRPSYPSGLQRGKASDRFARGFIPACQARRLWKQPLPAWTIFDNKLSPLSSTMIRAKKRWLPP